MPGRDFFLLALSVSIHFPFSVWNSRPVKKRKRLKALDKPYVSGILLEEARKGRTVERSNCFQFSGRRYESVDILKVLDRRTNGLRRPFRPQSVEKQQQRELQAELIGRE